MNIGIDLDEVLFPFTEPFLKFLNDKRSIQVSKEDITNYHFWEVPKTGFKTRDEAIKSVLEFYKSYGFNNASPILNSEKFVKMLGKNNTLFVITSRPSLLREKTVKWVNKYFKNIFSGIYFTNQFSLNSKGENKVNILKQLKCDLFIDDHYVHIEEAVRWLGINCILFLQPWNQKEMLMPNVFPANNWEEIYKIYSLLKNH